MHYTVVHDLRSVNSHYCDIDRTKAWSTLRVDGYSTTATETYMSRKRVLDCAAVHHPPNAPCKAPYPGFA